MYASTTVEGRAERAANILHYVDRWLLASGARLMGGDLRGATACMALAHDALDDARADLAPPAWCDEEAEAAVRMPPGCAEAIRRHLRACGARDAEGRLCTCGKAAAIACASCGALLAVSHQPGAPPCEHYRDAAAWLSEEER